MRAVRAPGVSHAVLKEFGFNVMAVEWPLDLEGVEHAVTAGLWLMPQLPIDFDPSRAEQSQLAQLLGELPFHDSVLCWDVGTNLGTAEAKLVTAAARDLRAATP